MEGREGSALLANMIEGPESSSVFILVSGIGEEENLLLDAVWGSGDLVLGNVLARPSSPVAVIVGGGWEGGPASEELEESAMAVSDVESVP
jgi:hypothetical protein